jgi:hypothetical protein
MYLELVMLAVMALCLELICQTVRKLLFLLIFSFCTVKKKKGNDVLLEFLPGTGNGAITLPYSGAFRSP